VAVVGAAATAKDSQAELLVNLPHSGGEVLGVIALWMVESNELFSAQGGCVGFELDQAAGATTFENICPFRKALAATEG
jgi:hypothetical protein